MPVDFPPALPHGPLEAVFPEIWLVRGTSRPHFMGADWQYSRNMTVLRDGDRLVLVNTVRLDDAGLAALDALGRVTDVVRIGAFHDRDDGFYAARYRAKQWALAGHEHAGGRDTDVELVPGGPMPVSGARLFAFETSKVPEALLVLDRDGGIVVSCDALQNWAAVDERFDEASAARMTAMGFIVPANVGPGWRMAAAPEKRDFERLAELPFRHLIPAHGTVLRDTAKEDVLATVRRLFP
jgi:hypothetical protein